VEEVNEEDITHSPQVTNEALLPPQAGQNPVDPAQVNEH